MAKETDGMANVQDLKGLDDGPKVIELNTDESFCPTYEKIIGTKYFIVDTTTNSYEPAQTVRYTDISLDNFTLTLNNVPFHTDNLAIQYGNLDFGNIYTLAVFNTYDENNQRIIILKRKDWNQHLNDFVNSNGQNVLKFIDKGENPNKIIRLNLNYTKESLNATFNNLSNCINDTIDLPIDNFIVNINNETNCPMAITVRKGSEYLLDDNGGYNLDSNKSFIHKDYNPYSIILEPEGSIWPWGLNGPVYTMSKDNKIKMFVNGSLINKQEFYNVNDYGNAKELNISTNNFSLIRVDNNSGYDIALKILDANGNVILNPAYGTSSFKSTLDEGSNQKFIESESPYYTFSSVAMFMKNSNGRPIPNDKNHRIGLNEQYALIVNDRLLNSDTDFYFNYQNNINTFGVEIWPRIKMGIWVDVSSKTITARCIGDDSNWPIDLRFQVEVKGRVFDNETGEENEAFYYVPNEKEYFTYNNTYVVRNLPLEDKQVFFGDSLIIQNQNIRKAIVTSEFREYSA